MKKGFNLFMTTNKAKTKLHKNVTSIFHSFIKKFDFKLDETTCHYSLKILPSGRTVEVVSVEKYQKRNSRCTQSMTYPGTLVEYFIGLSI